METSNTLPNSPTITTAKYQNKIAFSTTKTVNTIPSVILPLSTEPKDKNSKGYKNNR